MRGNRDLEIVVRAALVCALGALLVPVEVVRLIFAAPLVLFLPGYAIAATLVRRPPERLHLIPLGVGLSIATLALGGLVLNYLPGGLSSLPWALLLVAVTIGACRAAALRRPARRSRARRLPRPAPAGLAMALAGLAAATLAIALAFIPFSAGHAIGYTELWMRTDADAVRVGVGNQQHTRTAYDLQVKFGPTAAPVSRSIELDPGEETVIRLTSPQAPEAVPLAVVATLFRADDPEVAYRRVNGWILPPEASSP